MGKLPVLKPTEVVAVLQKLGFAEVRQRGSHKQYRHADGRCTTVPFHKGRDISPILLRQINKLFIGIAEPIRHYPPGCYHAVEHHKSRARARRCELCL